MSYAGFYFCPQQNCDSLSGVCCPTNFITETMCVQIEFFFLYRILQEIMKNTPVHVSFLLFILFSTFTFKHLITVSYLPINMMNRWAFSASLKPSRQCSCRLYHTEIYIVCQVQDSTKEFIIRPRKVMGFCMCKRFTFFISQPSATESIHKPSHYDSLITQRIWHLALSFVIKSLKLHLQQSAERQWMDPFIRQYHHVKTEVCNNF